jgi:hypothetical protein
VLLLLALLSGTQAPASAEVKAFPSKLDAVTNYRTYQWEPIRIVTRRGVIDDEPEVTPLIRQALNRELARKGYAEAADGADLKLLSMGLTSSTTQLEGYLLSYGFEVFWGSGVTAISTLQRVNKEGVLVVSLISLKTGKAVWTGYVTQAFGRPGTTNKIIDKAAARLIKKLPKRK